MLPPGRRKLVEGARHYGWQALWREDSDRNYPLEMRWGFLRRVLRQEAARKRGALQRGLQAQGPINGHPGRSAGALPSRPWCRVAEVQRARFKMLRVSGHCFHSNVTDNWRR